MGAADTSRVTRGTIAFISGIYEELINDWQYRYFTFKTWKSQGFKGILESA